VKHRCPVAPGVPVLPLSQGQVVVAGLSLISSGNRRELVMRMRVGGSPRYGCHRRSGTRPLEL